MKIPNKYKLFDNQYVIESKEDLWDEQNMFTGRHYSGENKIILQTPTQGLCEAIIEQTFFHELVHSILHKMNENELDENENFVEVFSQLLRQAINTMEFTNE